MPALAGAYVEAAELFEECLTLSRAERLASEEVDALHGLGWLATQRGHYARARTLLTQALTLACSIDYHEEMPVLMNLGRVLARTGAYDEAALRLHEAVRLARDQGRPEKLSDALRELGRLEVATGDLHHAGEHLRESLDIAERIVMREPRVEALDALAELELAHGRVPAARELVERAMRLGRADPALSARLRMRLAEAELAGGAPGTAEQLYRAAFEGAQRTGQEEMAALCLYGTARSTAATGDTVGARQMGEDSATRLRALDSPHAAEVGTWLEALD